MNQIQLVKQLSRVSPYAHQIESLIHLVPDLMKKNEQLRPLWELWCQNGDLDTLPKKVFTKTELKILQGFFEYLYFASDNFIKSIETKEGK